MVPQRFYHNGFATGIIEAIKVRTGLAVQLNSHLRKFNQNLNVTICVKKMFWTQDYFYQIINNSLIEKLQKWMEKK